MASRALHLRHAGHSTSDLERRLSEFLGTEDTILYGSCFDANGGLFETLLGAEDAVISDELNHASIIDGIRLCKAQRLRYRNSDMADLEAQLQEAVRRPLPADRHRRRVLDGRLRRPAAGDLRPGREVRCAGDGGRLARRRVHGPERARHARAARRDRPGRHPHRHAGQGPGRCQRRLHQRRGAKSSNCCASARGRTCSRTRSRRRSPGLAQACSTCSSGRATCATAAGEHRVLPRAHDRARLRHPARRPSDRAGHARRRRAGRAAGRRAAAQGVYVIGFSYPVVPQGKARIRTQISAAHTLEELDFAVEQFVSARDEVI